MSGIVWRVWASSPFWDVEHERSGAYDEARGRRIGEMLPAKPGRPVLLAESTLRLADGMPTCIIPIRAPVRQVP